MKPFLIAIAGAFLTVLAFPPFDLGPLVVFGMALFLYAVRKTGSRRQGFWVGYVYGLVFFGGLMWWLGLLHFAALGHVLVQSLFPALFAFWLSRYSKLGGASWLLLAAGGWAVMELVRYRFPVGGSEWGATGYAMFWVKQFAPIVGTSGLTVLAAATGAALVLEKDYKSTKASRLLVVIPIVVLFLGTLSNPFSIADQGPGVPVAIVQGSGPCPFEKCPPDQRLRTFEHHLALTRTIEAGSVDIVVWPESSTGSFNADPALNPEIRELIGAEARRIGAWIMVGGDRPLNETHWVNVNVLFNPEGEVVGEYHKQLPVPFGEWIPLRPFFTRLISDLDRVPRDMIPGDGPVVFDVSLDSVSGIEAVLGSVISWEGGFSRFARGHAVEGAQILVVATNNESYGPNAPTADQFIGMTRMRAAELEIPVIHAAVTGKSVLIGPDGAIRSETTGLGTEEVLIGHIRPGWKPSIYTRTGDLLMILAAVSGLLVWIQERRLVVSSVPSDEEE